MIGMLILILLGSIVLLGTVTLDDDTNISQFRYEKEYAKSNPWENQNDE